MKIQKQNEKGITLISLIVTIIILLILAGVAISSLTGENGLITRAKQAKIEQMKAEARESIQLAILDIQTEETNAGRDVTLKTLYEKLPTKNDKIQVEEYTEGSKILEGIYNSSKQIRYTIDENFNVEIGNVLSENEQAFEIEITEITSTSLKVTGNEEQIKKSSPVKFKYVAQTLIGDKTEFVDITETSYILTGLKPGTQYKVYMFAYDKQGNERKSIVKTIMTKLPDATQDGIITFGDVTWENEKASITISTSTSYDIEYQVNSIEGTWKKSTTVSDLVHNDIVYVRLTNGTEVGDYTSITIKDEELPTATIVLSTQFTYEGTTITATVTHSDDKSGVNIENCKWVYNTVSTEIGTETEKYTDGTFSSKEQIINLKADTANTYYLHVLTKDKAGNLKETVSKSITVESLQYLSKYVQVGDYVKYEVDEASTATINSLLTELGTYSGSTLNSSSTLVQETNLNWRVLDKVKDENGNDCVRLISATPTATSTVALKGYNGYNNAVYLIDKVCSTLYNKTGYTEKVQNLKIEDIEEYMKTKPTYDTTTKYSPTDKFYPSILAQEEGQTVNGKTGTVGKSEQDAPITQTASQKVSSWSLIYTYWNQTMTPTSFEDGYYNLFMNDGKANYKPYWMSSRCVIFRSELAGFDARYVSSGIVAAYGLYNSAGSPYEDAYAVRPVITLKSNVQIDTEKLGDGTEVGKEYILK